MTLQKEEEKKKKKKKKERRRKDKKVERGPTFFSPLPNPEDDDDDYTTNEQQQLDQGFSPARTGHDATKEVEEDCDMSSFVQIRSEPPSPSLFIYVSR